MCTCKLHSDQNFYTSNCVHKLIFNIILSALFRQQSLSKRFSKWLQLSLFSPQSFAIIQTKYTLKCQNIQIAIPVPHYINRKCYKIIKLYLKFQTSNSKQFNSVQLNCHLKVQNLRKLYSCYTRGESSTTGHIGGTVKKAIS